MTTRKPRTWESIYWASRRRGDDPAYSLFLADEWQKRQKGKRVSAVTKADIERTAADTVEHIRQVQHYLGLCIVALEDRGIIHDASKLQEPERTGYAALQVDLRNVEYGTDEYRAALAAARPVIDHHYQANRHHPEHWPGGVEDMTLIDLVEMLCDWKAASLRTKQGSILASIDHNEQRFKLSAQLATILRNTVKEMGW